MRWHIVQGEAGCDFALRQNCTAVVVDALRASATAAMLLHAGVTEIHVVRSVEDAFAARVRMPDALLYGERGGVPPEGFDGGNSPREAWRARGRRVIFTTTTGAQWLVRSWGAPAVLMGTTLNAGAVIDAVNEIGRDVVLIPAGLADDRGFSAQEDWVAASAIAMSADVTVEQGAEEYKYWAGRIEAEGIPALFAGAPHAEKLRRVNLVADIEYCARTDLTAAVPAAVERSEWGVLVRSFGRQGREEA